MASQNADSNVNPEGVEEQSKPELARRNSQSSNVSSSPDMMLFVADKVNLELNFVQYAGRQAELLAAKVVATFEIVGPQEKLDFLKHERGVDPSDLKSFISPPHAITIEDPEEKNTLGIPVAATAFSFVYPMKDLTTGKLHNWNPSEKNQWAFLLLLGGFVYFNQEGGVECVNALTNFPSPTRVYLDGPFTASQKAITCMVQSERMMAATLDALVKVGFKSFGWVHPDEKLHTEPLGKRAYPQGAFAYQTTEESAHGGSPIYFLLNMDHVTKKLFVASNIPVELEFPDYSGRQSELLNAHGRVGYRISGPSDHLKRLQRNAIHEPCGFISPPSRITMPFWQRSRAGIPKRAAAFCFMYPIQGCDEQLQMLISRLQREGNSSDIEWLQMLQLGGYVYFDKAGQVERVNALAVGGEQCIYLEGPIQANVDAVDHLTQNGSMQKTTLTGMVAAGFESFGWVRPSEPLPKPLGTEGHPLGAFVYTTTADSRYSGKPIYFKLKGRPQAVTKVVDFDALAPENKVMSDEPALMHLFAKVVQRVPKRLQNVVILGIITTVPLFYVSAVALCLTLLVSLSYWSEGGIGYQFCATLIWIQVVTFMLWTPLKDTAFELLSRSKSLRQKIWVIPWIATFCDLIVRAAASRGDVPRHRTHFVMEATLVVLGVLTPFMLRWEGKSMQARVSLYFSKHNDVIAGEKSMSVLPASVNALPHRIWTSFRGWLGSFYGRAVSQYKPSSRHQTAKPAEVQIDMASSQSETDISHVASESETVTAMPRESPTLAVAADDAIDEEKTQAAGVLQGMWRKRQQREKTKEHKRVQERLASFSWPILFATIVNLLGNIIVDHTFDATTDDRQDRLRGGSATFLNLWWLVMLAPCLFVIFVIDSGNKTQPQKSTTHVVFFVLVLYLATYKVACFTPWVYSLIHDSLGEADEDPFSFQALAAALAPTIAMMIHIFSMVLLIRTARTTLNFITAPNTLTYFLFPFQFFDFAFNYTFFGLMSKGRISPGWILQQAVLQIFCFLRNSGTLLGLQTQIMREGPGLLNRLLTGGTDSTDTGGKSTRDIEKDASRSTETVQGPTGGPAKKRNRIVAKQVGTDFADPIFRLIHIGTMAVQFDIAEISAIFLVPIASYIFIRRDGWFTIQGTGLLVRDCQHDYLLGRVFLQVLLKLLSTTCARIFLMKTMQKQLQAERTVHGVSPIAARIKLSLAAAPNCPIEWLAEEEMSKIVAKYPGTAHDQKLLNDELSLSNLKYTMLARRKLARHGVFYFIIMLFTMFATLPVTRLVPSAELKSCFGNLTASDNMFGDLSIFNQTTIFNEACSVEPRYDSIQLHMTWEYVDPKLTYSLDPALQRAFQDSVTRDAIEACRSFE